MIALSSNEPTAGVGAQEPRLASLQGKGHVYILYQPVFIPETSKGPENGCLIGLGSCQMNKSGKRTPSPSPLHHSEPRTRGICGWSSALASGEPLHPSGQAWRRSRNKHLLGPSSQRLPTTRLHVHSWSMPTVEWRWLSNTAALGTWSWRLPLAEAEGKAWRAVSYLRTSVQRDTSLPLTWKFHWPEQLTWPHTSSDGQKSVIRLCALKQEDPIFVNSSETVIAINSAHKAGSASQGIQDSWLNPLSPCSATAFTWSAITCHLLYLCSLPMPSLHLIWLLGFCESWTLESFSWKFVSLSPFLMPGNRLGPAVPLGILSPVRDLFMLRSPPL